MLYVFRYHCFVHVNPLKLFHRLTLSMHVAPFFLSVFLGSPDLRVSILLFVSYPPKSYILTFICSIS